MSNRKKTVLMVAYSFPPSGNAGSYRPLRFVRNLETMGWHAKVVSADKPEYERYDPALLDSVPTETEVIRVRNQDPWQLMQAKRKQRLQNTPRKISNQRSWGLGRCASLFRSLAGKCVRKLEAWCYHPDQAMPWIRPATKACLSVCARKRPDVLWATAGPVSSFFVAENVFCRTGVPYVLDFRDAKTITFNEFSAIRPGWARLGDRRSMYRQLKGARAVVFLYDTVAECFWQGYPGALDPARIHIIPNGFEGKVEGSAPLTRDTCTLLYAGTLSSYCYGSLLTALIQLKATDPDRARLLKLRFVGDAMEPLAQEINKLRLHDIVEIIPPVTHAVIAQMQREAHALILLGRPRTMKGYELFAGAKLFGYLKSGRPIVGLLPDDETKKILRRVGVSTIADPDSPNEITGVLNQVLDAWAEGWLGRLVPNRHACEAYSASRQTAALVRALDGAAPTKSFVPGSVAVPASLRHGIAKRQSLFCGTTLQSRLGARGQG